MLLKNTDRIVLFDGVCNLCNSSIVFIIQRDPKNLFKFAALQSEPGLKLIKKYNIDTSSTDSILLIEGNKCYVKSTAALRITRHLSGGWPLLYGLIIFPALMRNWGYDFIARNRYKWYGKKDSCMIPTPELKEKFL